MPGWRQKSFDVVELLVEALGLVDYFDRITNFVTIELDDSVHDVQHFDHELLSKLVESRFGRYLVIQILQVF
jgi:hypothetical protein